MKLNTDFPWLCVMNMKHYNAWFQKLRKQYGILTALQCFMYNAKHYDIDGNYK